MVDLMDSNPTPEPPRIRPRSIAINGLFTLALMLVIYVAKPVLLPIFFALLLSLVLYPVHLRLIRWLRFPPQVSAMVILIGFILAIAWASMNLTQPAIAWFGNLPGSIDQIQAKVQHLREPISRVSAVAERIDELTNLPAQETPEPSNRIKAADGLRTPRGPIPRPTPDPAQPVTVKVATGGIGETVITNVSQFGVHFAMTVILMFFMLAYGDVFNRRLAGRGRAMQITREISSNVSSYLFTVTVINTCLGIAIGIAMYLLGMPNPVLWGVMAAVVNYVPYLGALVGIATVFFVALITFDGIGQIIVVPLVYFSITSIEGNFITPMVLGNRFTLNPIFIFIWLLFWGWFWGVPGGVIAMPLLMAFKIVCDHFKSMEAVSDMISLDPRRRWRIQS